MPARNQSKNAPVLPKIQRTNVLDETPDVDLRASGNLELSEESKYILKLSDKIDSLIERLDAKDRLIEKLQSENEKLKIDFQQLERRVDDLEMESRQNDIIISGKDMSPVTTGEDTRSAAIDLLRNKVKYNLRLEDVVSARRLGRKPLTQALDRRSILLTLGNNELKNDVIQMCRTSKPLGIFINDNLIATRATILYHLRAIKKKCPDRIAFCGSRNGNVFTWIKPLNPNGRNQKMSVNSFQALEKLCVDELKLDFGELMKDKQGR